MMAMITIDCPHCKGSIHVREDWAWEKDTSETDLAKELAQSREEALILRLNLTYARVLVKRLLQDPLTSYEIAQLEQMHPWLNEETEGGR